MKYNCSHAVQFLTITWLLLFPFTDRSFRSNTPHERNSFMSEKKNRTILVTNDDGIDSPGLIRLAEIAKEFGTVFVFAPSSQCSAMSQRLTLYYEMEICRRDEFPAGVETAWSLTGTPADCVKAALRILPFRPDLILSGINDGFNTGFDIAYSGTCGACFEALFNGIPAIAFSNQNHESFEVLDRHITSLTADLLERHIEANAFWNLNFPGCGLNDFRGILYDRIPAPMQLYSDHMPQRHTEDGQWFISERGIPIEPEIAPNGTDAHAVLNGYISVGKVYSSLL